jgi:hypothetical protein
MVFAFTLALGNVFALALYIACYQRWWVVRMVLRLTGYCVDRLPKGAVSSTVWKWHHHFTLRERYLYAKEFPIQDDQEQARILMPLSQLEPGWAVELAQKRMQQAVTQEGWQQLDAYIRESEKLQAA